MSAYPLNYAIRDTNGQLSGNLGWLFTMYWLHSDSLLRCYPGNDLLKKECGMKSTATLVKHRDKLIEMKALIIVPHDKRITEKEKSLQQRKYIYQITGVMELSDGTIIPTVHINSPEMMSTHVSILSDLGFDTSLIFKAHGQPVIKEDSNTEIKGSKNEPLKVQKMNVSIIEPEVVQEKLLSSKGEVKTEPDPQPLDADGYLAKAELLRSAGVITLDDYPKLNEVADDYTLDQWQRGLMVLAERHKSDKTKRRKGLAYLMEIMPDIEAEDRQKSFVEASQKPKVVPVLNEPLKRPRLDDVIVFDKKPESA